MLFREALRVGFYELQDARDSYRQALGLSTCSHISHVTEGEVPNDGYSTYILTS